VVHSFGGLILQQALRIATDRSATEPRVAAFVSRVSRITFLGTPHRGAHLATWAGVLRLIIRPSSAAKGLARNDPNLRDLNQWFRRHAANQGIATQTLTESRRTYFFLIVPPDSSDAGLPSDPIPVDADHFALASPSSRQSEIYVHIRNFLKERLPPRGRRTLLDAETLQGVAADTTANVKTLERIENALKTTIVATDRTVVLPRGLVDAEAARRLDNLRKSRFFVGARPEDRATRLAVELLEGDLSFASPDVKARGLAWCARLLLGREDRTQGQELLRAARQHGGGEEVSIAEAFEQSYADNLDRALSTLSTLNSTSARSAAFIIAKRKKTPAEALEWLRKAGLTFLDIDSDGKFFVIATQLDADQFDEALANCVGLAPADFEETPALWPLAAAAHVVSTAPRELALSILSMTPSYLVSVPLAGDTVSVQRRQHAKELYNRAAESAATFDCLDASYEAKDRALTLGVRDPINRQAEIAELEQSMRLAEHSLRRLPIALECGLKVDLAAAEQEIERQIALEGGASLQTALARLAIARTKPPAEAADYIQRYRSELTKYLNPFYLAGIEIASLVDSRQLQLAQERLQALSTDFPSVERERLSLLVAEALEADPTASRERQFAATDALPDLALLVEALERSKDWKRLAKYAAILFERTRDVPTCALYAQSLFKIGDFNQVVQVLGSHQDLLEQSTRLQSLLAWSLYSLGHVNDCRVVLSKLRAQRDAPEDRHLTVNLAITSGDWNSLASFVEQEWERRSDRSAEELLRAGQIAHQLASARERALISEAAAKAGDDPHVLLGCYSAAISAGWEDEATFKWLERAAALSDANGPVQKMSLKDVVERNPGWQKRETQAWEQLHAGAIPMVAAGKMLHRSLIDLALLPAIANAETVDPRRRTLVYSYSGTRRLSAASPESFAIDPTALLNAGMLGLLDRMFAIAKKVVVPHSTLAWLFEEKQRIRFHQPSKIADAHQIKRLLDANVLQRFEATAPGDEDLIREVGSDLASLFAEAEADWGDDSRPRLVVRSRPVHRVGSLMEEEADLSSHAGSLCGCLDVIEALARQGRVTRVEEERARAFLKLHETPWTHTVAIVPGSVLYLDGVSVAHFQHLGLLQKFEASGFTAIIPAEEVAEGDRLIRYEALAGRASAVVDHIRQALSDGIMNGRVVLAPRLGVDDENDDQFHHPALDIILVSGLADVAVIDDRFLNQHATVSHGGVTTPILTTADLLAGWQLTRDEHAEHMTHVRSAGLAFLPLSREELDGLLARAATDGDRLIETAELRAVREYLLLCRMSTGLQLPKESVWFDGVIRVLIETLKDQWREGADLAAARVRSEWLLRQLDLRGWAHRYANEGNRGISEVRFRAQLLALMTFNLAASTNNRRTFWEWLDQALVDDVQSHHHDVYDALVGDVVKLISGMIARQQTGDADAE